METYEWKHNKAVVDRMYYTERIFCGTTLFAATYTSVNMLYIQKNYFADLMKARIPKVWKMWAVINVVVPFVCLRPLTKQEMQKQWTKRLLMGKYFYTL